MKYDYYCVWIHAKCAQDDFDSLNNGESWTCRKSTITKLSDEAATAIDSKDTTKQQFTKAIKLLKLVNESLNKLKKELESHIHKLKKNGVIGRHHHSIFQSS